MSAFLTAFAAFVMLLTGPPQAAKSKSEDSKKANEVTDKKACEPQCGSPTLIEKQVVYSAPSEKKEDEKAEQHPKNTQNWSENVNAFSTTVIAVFTILLFFGVLRQIHTSRAIERAWVMADLHWRDRVRIIRHTGRDADATTIDLDLTYQNDGNTPAWITEIRVRLDIVEAVPRIPAFDSIREGDFVELRPRPVTVSGKDTIRVDCRCQGLPSLGRSMVVYGFLKYRDIFMANRRTNFGYMLDPNDNLERIAYPNYNQNI